MKTVMLEKDQELQQETVSAAEPERHALQVVDGLLRRSLKGTGKQSRPKLVGSDGQAIELPEPIFHLLRQIVPHLAKGRALTIVPLQHQLTTQQAADILNVSRPFLIGLLERGEIPYGKTGKHRRISFDDLLTYKRRRDASRREAVDRLTALSQEYGLDAHQD